MIHSSLRQFTVFVVFVTVLGLAGTLSAVAVDPDDDPGSPVGRSQLSEAHFLFDAVFNDGDAGAAAELIAPGAVIQTPYGEYEGPDGLLEYVAIIHRAYPDASFEITRITDSAGSLVVEWTMSATHTHRDPVGLPATLQIERAGVATIGFGESGISALELEYGELVATSPEVEAAYDPRPGQPF